MKLFFDLVYVAILVLGIIEWSSREHPDALSRTYQLGIRVVSASVLAFLGLFGGQLSPILLVMFVQSVLLIQVDLDIAARLRDSGKGSDNDVQTSVPAHL